MTALLCVRLFKRSKHNTIVLTGLSGSGKTVLFYQLRDGSFHQGTVTSMEPNEGTFVLHYEMSKVSFSCAECQTPGLIELKNPLYMSLTEGKNKACSHCRRSWHSRFRPKLDEFLPQAAGIVFVVDALQFLPTCCAASEASVVRKKIPVLILCNKVDKVTAHTKEFIQKQLEKEIDKLRTSRTALSAADIANEFSLGVPGEAFVFSQCQNKVTVTEASGLSRLTGEISQLELFIREHAKA